MYQLLVKNYGWIRGSLTVPNWLSSYIYFSSK